MNHRTETFSAAALASSAGSGAPLGTALMLEEESRMFRIEALNSERQAYRALLNDDHGKED